MVIIFWDSQGVVHCEFIPASRGINKEVYLQTMRNLRENIHWRCQVFGHNRIFGCITMAHPHIEQILSSTSCRRLGQTFSLTHHIHRT